MKSSRLKDLIKNKDSSISFKEYRIRYATERFILRLQKSKYRDKFVLKGGFLLGVYYDINQRTTSDLDTHLKNIEVSLKKLKIIVQEIVDIDLADGVVFSVKDMIETQEQNDYGGYRVKLKMNFIGENSVIYFDLDIGVGDVITPPEREISIPLLFNEEKGKTEAVVLSCYPIETVLAEKLETILRLGVVNSRMKDFYDLQLILSDSNKPSIDCCFDAFNKTWLKRHKEPLSKELFKDWYFILEEIKNDTDMLNVKWPNYVKDRSYARVLKFDLMMNNITKFVQDLETYLL